MREALARKRGRRLCFTATFEKMGTERDAYTNRPDGGPAVLLLNVTYRGEVLADHVWLPYGNGLRELGRLVPGDVISFEAGVGSYRRGYLGAAPALRELRPPRVDYHLVNPKSPVFVARSIDAKDAGVARQTLVQTDAPPALDVLPVLSEAEGPDLAETPRTEAAEQGAGR